jgi:membrane-bound serine protease (ClpP class)
MTPLLWCILLLVLGLAFIFLEMFVPSAGILGFLSAAAILCSIVLAYVNYGPITGTVFLAVAAILVPAAIALALRWYPSTPLGRMIMSEPPTPAEVAPQDEPTARARALLKGRTGIAKTALMPGGSIKIDGRTYDAVGQGEAVEAGEHVLVVRVELNHLIVRKLEGEPPPPTAYRGDDVLAQPIEALGIEPLDDPLS